MIHLQSEFSSYKIRANALLQKKEAELAAANNSEQIKALEEALKVHALFLPFVLNRCMKLYLNSLNVVFI